MEIHELLDLTIKNNASDLHLLPGIPPAIRIDGNLRYLTSYTAISPQEMETMLFSILKPEQKELLINNKEIDFSFGFGGGAYGDLGRFRTNLYYQRGVLSAAFGFCSRISERLKNYTCRKFAIPLPNLNKVSFWLPVRLATGNRLLWQQLLMKLISVNQCMS